MKAHFDPEAMRVRLLQVVADKGLSLREVSLHSGNSESYLSGVLKRGRDPQLANFINVCEYLQVSVSWALYGYEITADDEALLQLLRAYPSLSERLMGLVEVLQNENTFMSSE